ncbi:hypothetical protein DL766_000137 [Monosporascus sp. MC13-8B]|uniref:TECPR1-like DysF domain-containing protein n=1 Tax=Monosporascus cannonballus TaxID=155416 RepID=A0ABY0HHX0_9PEZI|nr:hypothetical protein DL762_002338 [Monosporascus cannonballus]RYO97466.1 hypothetical protein DL763_002734 [Monosporascus cannonballus]RYP40113.1 hypothetical protein DL766_000137 [Monosporascus sp. MC13-8B]
MGKPRVFVNRDDPIPTSVLDGSRTPSRSVTPSQRGANHDSDHSEAEAPSRPGGLRGRFSALKGKANIQDHLVEKLLQQVIPADGGHAQPEDERSGDGSNGSAHATTERPNFNITTMSVNFRRFNARIGVVFVFQERVERLLSWHQPTHTLSFLAIYTFVCLDPYLLPLLPLAVLLVAVLIPSFAARHPDPEMSLSGEQALGGSAPYSYYSPWSRGPPLAPAVTVRPAKELSRDFFRNMRDLQNSMEDFSQLHDAVVSLMVPRTNFSDEALSSALFAALFAACLVLSIASAALPWRLIFLAAGWAATCAGHPAAARALEDAHRTHVRPQSERALSLVGRWAADDVILDASPETREVEIFELQRLSPAGGEWEPWLFSASPYDPLSPARIAGEKPAGARFFEDVLPPKGWEWSEKKWALDLWSREWVEERIITGVEIETEGERWVYDIYDENADRVGVVEDPAGEAKGGKEKGGKGYVPGPSWEEGEDGDVKRGEWRRRRWVRLVKRKRISDS